MSDPLIGQKLGDYIIQDLLGRGGMARVYRGYDDRLQRYAAVKVINNITATDQAEYTERFRREARAIARLHHPNIVGVYQFGEFEEIYYMAMVFIEGEDLRQILRRYEERGEVLPMGELLNIVRGIASGLDYAHHRGVIHRDVKPSNIMIDSEDRPVLTDFGLALSTAEGTTGETFGSAHYIAPEQAVSSAKAVAQSDLYSLGVCVYEMLAGKVPFDDPSAMSVALKHLRDAPPPLRSHNPEVSPAVEEVVLRMLEKDPANRYNTGAEFVRALEAAVSGVPLPDKVASEDSTVELPAAKPTQHLAGTNPLASDGNEDTPSGKPSGLLNYLDPEKAEELKRRAEASKAEPKPVAPPIVSESPRSAGSGNNLLKKIAKTEPEMDDPPRRKPAEEARSPRLKREQRQSVAADPEIKTDVVDARAVRAAAGKSNIVEGIELPPLEEVQKPPRRLSMILMASALVGIIIVGGMALAALGGAFKNTPTSTPTATNTSIPTIPPTATINLTATQAAMALVLTQTAQSIPTATNTITPTQPATQAATATTAPATQAVSGTTKAADVVLIYSKDQLALMNNTDHVIDVSGLSFVQHSSENRHFEAILWKSDGAFNQPGSLNPQLCLQIVRNTVNDLPDPPKDCRSRGAWIKLAQFRWFWLPPADNSATTFDVILNNKTLTTCDMNAGRCEFSLS